MTKKREGLLDYESVALDGNIYLKSEGDDFWYLVEDYPHINSFDYYVYASGGKDGEDKVKIGFVRGYIIAHSGNVSSEEIIEEADGLDGEIYSYTEYLAEELRVTASVLNTGFDLACISRLLIVSHLQAEPNVDTRALMRLTVASLALKEAPSLILVDPYEMPTAKEVEEELRTERQERRRIPRLTTIAQMHMDALSTLGFIRMVTAPHMWGWSTEIADMSMDDYSRAELVKATVTLYANKEEARMAPVDGGREMTIKDQG